MGWCYGSSSRQALIEELTKDWGNEHQKTTTLAKCFRGYTLMWTVHERTYLQGEDAGQTMRFIGCYLMRNGGERDGWGYKALDESCGPCEVSCPLSYLAMVDDPGGYATKWREEVRAYWAGKRNVGEKTSQLSVGQEVLFKAGWHVKGDKESKIEKGIVASLKPLRFRVPGYYDRVRMPRKAIDFDAMARAANKPPEPEPQEEVVSPGPVETIMDLL